MTQMNDNIPSFNLWTEPWIALEDARGELTHHSIRDTLVSAHEYVAIYDPSPLVVVGIHRVLTAILQDVQSPQENDDLNQLWAHGSFSVDAIDRFGTQYANRFDLFSEDRPFLQSADLPLTIGAKELEDKESVARLFADAPTGEEVTHYHHIRLDEHIYCPATAAMGLLTIPPFSISGGRGYIPSINGKPPIYVMPSGKTLFEILSASLLTKTLALLPPEPLNGDLAWWRRDTPIDVVKSSRKEAETQLTAVGYLHGLLFPSRRVRLFPEKREVFCTRCGKFSSWVVRKMEYSNGESRRSDAPFWRDPFVAYLKPISKAQRKSSSKTGQGIKGAPDAIRPMLGKAAWREFTGLFLQSKDERTLRPSFLGQLLSLKTGTEASTLTFRCVALQTNPRLQAKIHEWLDFGFVIPPSLLQDEDGAFWTEQALSFTTECGKVINAVFYDTFRRKAQDGKRAKKSQDERFKRLKDRLEADYWAVLADKFRQFVLDLDDRAQQQQTLEGWHDTVVREAQNAFDSAADATGDDGRTLLEIERGKATCHSALFKLRSKSNQKEDDDAQKRT